MDDTLNDLITEFVDATSNDPSECRRDWDAWNISATENIRTNRVADQPTRRVAASSRRDVTVVTPACPSEGARARRPKL
jgi:hypothetical protein